MIKVKISTSFKCEPIYLFRQSPKRNGVWGDVQFFVNDDTLKECDYWVVYEGLSKIEKTFCPKENVYLITGEPPSIKGYKRFFLKQFVCVITCHRDIKHKNKIYWQQAMPWHIGWRQTNPKNTEFSMDYDDLNFTREIQKTRLISVISSNKSKIKEQRDRLEFMFFLKEYFKDKIDLFGRGINEIEDKWDAIAPYKYHVVLENSCYDDYFSEKLSDAFLGEAYPIYSGASNVYSYFSKDSLVCIDIKKPSVAVKIIETIMANEFYEKYRASIIKSKMKVLNEYNLFPTVLDKFINIDNNMSRAKMEIVLKPEQYYGFKGIETRIGDSVKVIKKFTRADKNV